MSKHRVVVLKIITKQLTVTQAAHTYGISRRHLHRLLARYRDGGPDVVESQSRRPHSHPHSTPPHVQERIVQFRNELTAQGMDAGPATNTTRSALTGPSAKPPQHRPTRPPPKRSPHPVSSPAITGSATTTLTRTGKSHSAEQAACTTSASAPSTRRNA